MNQDAPINVQTKETTLTITVVSDKWIFIERKTISEEDRTRLSGFGPDHGIFENNDMHGG